jgi:hypothetical protein
VVTVIGEFVNDMTSPSLKRLNQLVEGEIERQEPEQFDHDRREGKI